MATSSTDPILVLGSGPTGLAAAYRLAKAGKPVKVIERLPWIGGLSASFKRGPYTLDLGPHRFTPHNQEVFDLVKNLCGDELETVRYRAEILLAKKYFLNYPLRMSEFLTRIPPTISAELIVPAVLAALKPKKGKQSKNYEEWVLERFGSGVTANIFRPLVEKVWGTPLHELSARFAWQRIATLSLWEILVETLTGRRHERFHSPYYPDNGFLYPKNGFGTITDRLGEGIQKAGGEIVTGATVKSVQHNGKVVTSVTYEKDGQSHTQNCSAVISTIPIKYFFENLQPAVPPEVLQAAQQLKMRRLVILYLTLKKEYFTPNTSMYFPDSSIAFGRLWEQKNHSPATIPDKNHTVIGLEIPCWPESDLWSKTDQQLLSFADPLIDLKLMKREDIVDVFSVKLGYVYPVWNVPFETYVNKLLEFEGTLENLLLNGRPGLFFYNNLHHSLDMGLAAADHLLSGESKATGWKRQLERFESFHLVE